MDMTQPIYSPDGNFVWDGNQWVSIPQALIHTLPVLPKIQPISSGMQKVDPSAETQSLRMKLRMGRGHKNFGKTRIEITGINQSLKSLIELFQSGILTSISENMLQTDSTENSLCFVKTGKMLNLHLDVVFHDDRNTGKLGNMTKIQLDMYFMAKYGAKDIKKHSFRVCDLRIEPIKGSPEWVGKRKFQKLEADLLEILASG